MENKLKVGDVIYGENSIYGINGVYKIKRLTDTQAISGNTRFKNEILSDGRIIKIGQSSDMWNRTHYYIETDELKEKYFRQNAVSTLKLTDYSKLETKVLESLLSVLKQES